MHIVDEYFGVLLEPLFLEQEPLVVHPALLHKHILHFVDHQRVLFKLLVDLLKGIDFAAIGVASDQLLELLQLGGLFAGHGLQVVYGVGILHQPLLEWRDQLCHHLTHPSLHLEPLELPNFVPGLLLLRHYIYLLEQLSYWAFLGFLQTHYSLSLVELWCQ